MDELTEIKELVSNFIEIEKKKPSHYDVYIKNYFKCLCKEDDHFISLIKQKQEDEKQCNEIRQKIEDLKLQVRNSREHIAGRENEIKKLETQIVDVKAKQELLLSEELLTNLKNLSTRGKSYVDDTFHSTNSVLKLIKYRQKLYNNCLGCDVEYEEPNRYIFSFPVNDDLSGRIIFRFDQSDVPSWTVSEFEPPDLLNSEELDDFQDHQDTQKLLSGVILKINS